jgi:hypothetical protein
MRSDRFRGRGGTRRVALFVDHGGLHAATDRAEAGSPGDVVRLAERLAGFAASLGRVSTAIAYADWSTLGDDALAFRRRGIEPRLVLPAESGDDRSDVVLALDALEVALTVPSVVTFVLATVDASLHDLVVRLRRSGREVVVCGPRDLTADELTRQADRFVPFESLLSESRAAAVPAETASSAAPVEVDWETYDWSRFLRLVDELERRLNFVGLKYLNHKVLNRENCGFDDRARRQALINHAIDDGILEIYQIDNIEAGADPVTACRLNRGHERVRAFLGPDPADEATVDGPTAEAVESVEPDPV